ncbi:hypothetical protein [Microbacterium sp. MYb66]|uniref:hypothetical protein n=1 Tax=Microbacterium sp. MYb66 TaxID=1848692 RepID=UPI000D0114E7|nr:hypothetical protein [Microbacterium sp. MYb66]PRA81519.1 hypothetical protein CQ045_09915 [Microbacterium sp. MYb66]
MTGPLPADAATPPRPRPRRRRVLPIVVITVLVSLGLLAALAIPVIVRGLTATTSPHERTIVLTSETATATIVLPGGWSWLTPFGDESRGVAGSPDRAMTVEFALLSGTDAPAALEQVAPGPLGPASEEILSDRPAGIEQILHARVLDQEIVVGAVTEAPVTLTFVSDPSPAYDAELADLLATIEVRR